MIRYFYSCLISVMCLCNCALQAQHTLVLGNNENDISLSPHAYVYAGQASLAGFDAVLHSDSNQLVRNTSPEEINYGINHSRAWCVFFIRNESNQQEWFLKIQQSRVDTAQLYIVRENNVIEKLPMTGHFQTFSERPVHALPFAYAISIKKNETVALYLYTARQYGRHAAITNLQTKNRFENYEYGFNIALGFVCGMVVLASFLGFFLFLFVREKLYIYYSIYTSSFFFVLLADTGFAHAVLLFPHDQTVTNGFTIVFYYLMGGCLGIFTIELLQLKQYAKPWLYWYGIIASYSFCFFGCLLLVPGLPHAIRWSLVSGSYYLAFITNIYILYIISVSVLKREPIVYFYMAGFFVTSIVGLMLTLSDFQLLNFPHQNKDFYYLTPFAEVLCVALGIGIHFSRTLKERVRVQLALNQTQDQIITIQEDERRRIAQDLHDDVGNSLAAIKNMVVQKRESTEVVAEINNLVNTVRTISHDLMPIDFNEFSLVEIIGHLVNKFKDHPTISIEFDYTGKPVKIKSTTELVIYRIINEIISNILKHSQATKAFIQLMYQEESLVITVEDNGIGMQTSKVAEGIGVRSMRLRADYINAKINFESDEKGTLIILEIPYGAI